MAEERSGFRVRGLVQGVGFRWWTQRKGLELGLSGSVMNQADGSVEVHVSGPSEVIAEFERWLSTGPPGSHVVSVDRTTSLLPTPTDFTIEG